MYKGKFLILAAAALFLFGAHKANAGELNINGFADIIYTIGSEPTNKAGFNSNGNPANSADRKTSVAGEVDFEYTEGPVTVRIDLDIPGSSSTSMVDVSDLQDGSVLVPVTDTNGVGVEQARADWMIPGGEALKLTFTGGAFNAPIGFEAQDAPDLYQTTNGQLWNLVPSNLVGGMLSAEYSIISGSVYAANEWRANDSEENSLGGLITVTPISALSVSAGYLTSPTHAGAALPAKGDGDILDIVASASHTFGGKHSVMLVGEYLKDEFNTGYAGVLNFSCENDFLPHAVTVRYDNVDADMESNYGAGLMGAALAEDAEFESLTVALTVGLAENLDTLVEWRRDDADVPGIHNQDVLSLEFIATF